MTRNGKRKTKKQKSVPFIEPDAAGIDIGATEIYVAVPEERDNRPVRKFATFTEDLHALADWLIACAIKTVAIESTGVYWIALFQILECRGLEVCLVNARHVKGVPGRKTDIQDCQWLQYLHTVGLLRGSFRPAEAVCAVRSILRHRDTLLQSASSQVLLMQKALTQMNLQLHNVISDITGVSGLAIIDAILLGEREPSKLAGLCDARIKASRQVVAKSLVGDYRPEHLFCLQQALASYRHFQNLIAACDEHIEAMLACFDSHEQCAEAPSTKYKAQGNQPAFDVPSEMHRILGVDLTGIPGMSAQGVLSFFCEVGPQITRFPSSRHFASWLGLCPDNRISGGKILSSKTRNVRCRLANALRMAATTLYRSHSSLGDYFRRLRAKLGSPSAITAAAHKLARILFAMLRDRRSFDPQLLGILNEKHLRRRQNSLRKYAASLGFELVPIQNLAHSVS
ncbi:MAG: IS110 family transposase [Terrimicrobiaceae bacterium]